MEEVAINSPEKLARLERIETNSVLTDLAPLSQFGFIHRPLRT